MEKSEIQSPRKQLPMSQQAFAEWGSGAFAYVKPETDGGINGYAIYAADGRHLAFVASRDAAQVLVMQNELLPVYVH